MYLSPFIHSLTRSFVSSFPRWTRIIPRRRAVASIREKPPAFRGKMYFPSRRQRSKTAIASSRGKLWVIPCRGASTVTHEEPTSFCGSTHFPSQGKSSETVYHRGNARTWVIPCCGLIIMIHKVQQALFGVALLPA